jgi:D-alanyl-D-alanine dipeptidase
MVVNGFKAYFEEYWHFADYNEYPVGEEYITLKRF